MQQAILLGIADSTGPQSQIVTARTSLPAVIVQTERRFEIRNTLTAAENLRVVAPNRPNSLR